VFTEIDVCLLTYIYEGQDPAQVSISLYVPFPDSSSFLLKLCILETNVLKKKKSIHSGFMTAVICGVYF